VAKPATVRALLRSRRFMGFSGLVQDCPANAEDW
jgi:hypothetical protein